MIKFKPLHCEGFLFYDIFIYKIKGRLSKAQEFYDEY